MQTRRSTRATGEAPPPVHGADKDLDPHKKPEHQKPKPTVGTSPPQPALLGTPRTKIIARKLVDRSRAIQQRHSRPVDPLDRSLLWPPLLSSKDLSHTPLSMFPLFLDMFHLL